ncbi:fumarate hydratase [Brachyspira hampsonii]|uniref:Fumarate hydratase n=2 Tax=Brachyspira hampsonii TaxID=1287055 RepID=A0A2U4FKM5_9SPIR|nr:fumarate hydratase [Brachyspira hampsonii]EKV57931.1 fumarate hydratase [Brachyspira hampsonii 30446]MBW5389893.1 fumarate hydratase [Brachyspira hampsonii]OEJ19440.1 fumarate hydratase [Brachyspira hampsonii]
MRDLHVDTITDIISKLCIEANINLNQDIKNAFIENEKKEENLLAKNILNILIENSEIASKNAKPICQDTGMAIVYMDIGMDVHFTGGNLTDAINKGVALGYTSGYLRKSVVNDPIERKNTNDNTPAIIHYNIVEGDKVKIVVAPKGFGSENMSRLKMFPPSAGIEGVKEFVYETVKMAGANACPPMIIGIGLGGTMEKCADIAKRALLREIGSVNEDPRLAQLEKELLENINKMNIGPSGFGGKTTALCVNINMYATHIAALPVCVCTGCHVTRHCEAVL